MRLDKETLSRMSISQLEGKLAEVKSEFSAKSTQLSQARQAQLTKYKKTRGGASARKQNLINQIIKIQKATSKVEGQILKIRYASEKVFNLEVVKATSKYRQRQEELKVFGTYKTVMSNYEKVLYWCECMNYTSEDLDKVLELYTIDELAEMSGDEFYDEVRAARIGVSTTPRDITEEAKAMPLANPQNDDIIMF